MGLFQRLFSGASEPTTSAGTERSPDQALSSVHRLIEEIRALQNEIRSLRESLTDAGNGPRTIRAASAPAAHAPETPPPSEDAVPEGRSRRRRRGGRGRSGDRPERPERGGDAYAEAEPGETQLAFRDEADPNAFRPRTPRPPPEDAPTGPLVDYLKERGVLVYEGQDDLSRNEAFDHLARHLGSHFDLLSPYYEKLKRLVASGRGAKFEVEHFTDQERSAAVQFGTLLHRHGMLKDFYYHRSPKKALRVIPTKDGKTGQFLTGGWLEIYVSLLMSRRLRAHVSPARCQLLYNVKGALPDGREFEADIMAVVESRMFWLECKTGNWQDYAARFRGLVNIFGVDRNSSGLLLLRAPDASTRARATDMLDMSLLALNEVDGFICRYLGVEPSALPDFEESAPAMGAAGSASGVPVPEMETIEAVRGVAAEGEAAAGDEGEGADAPLASVEPARRLGRVALPGIADAPAADSGSEAEGEGGRRRRRRRRRRGGAGAEAANLIEPLPIFGEDRADADAAEESGAPDATSEAAGAEGATGVTVAAADSAGGAAAPASAGTEAEGEPRRRRRGRRGGRRRRGGAKPSPFAALPEGMEPAAAEAGSVEEAGADDDEAAEPAAAATGSEPERRDELREWREARARARAEAEAAQEPGSDATTGSDADAAPVSEPAAPNAAPAAAPARTAAAAPRPQPTAKPPPAPEAAPKPLVTPKVGATGATIAPDWRKMVAGGQKKTDEAAG